MNSRSMTDSIKDWWDTLFNSRETKRKDKRKRKQRADQDQLSKLYDQECELLEQTLQEQISIILGQEQAIQESTLRIKQLLAQAGLADIDFSIDDYVEQAPSAENKEIQTDDCKVLDFKRLDEASDRIQAAIKESKDYQEELKEHAYQLEGGGINNGKH